MEKKLGPLMLHLYSVREIVESLRNEHGMDLGEVQVGYETVIEDLLDLLGVSKKQKELFWILTDPRKN